MHRLDLRGWAPGATAKPELVLKFPEEARGLNGSCLIAPDTILIADFFAGLIWRVDLSPSGKCEKYRQLILALHLSKSCAARHTTGDRPPRAALQGSLRLAAGSVRHWPKNVARRSV